MRIGSPNALTFRFSGLLASATLAAAGCGGSTTVTARVVHPAAVPLRSFPAIWIASSGLPEEDHLASAVAAHLSDGQSEIHQVNVDALEPARVAGQIPPASAVMILEIDVDEATVTRWGSRPDTICGPAGCYSTTRSYAYNVPALAMTLKLTVYDGPTARVLRRMTLRERDSGRDFEVLRSRTVERLAERIGTLVDRRSEEVEVELLEVDHPVVERAIRAVDDGDWHEGRTLLEEVPDSRGWRSLDRETRAKILYNLGQARRFDPTTMDSPDRHFRAAQSALSAAARLDDSPIYGAALGQLAAHRARSEQLRRQDESAARNFAAQRDATALPPVPQTYQRPSGR